MISSWYAKIYYMDSTVMKPSAPPGNAISNPLSK